MGGAYGGGVHFTQFHESHGFTSFWGKRHIFKATGGAIMGGRMEGCLNVGADGGLDIRHTWWGAGGALGTHMKHFLPKKKTRFFFISVFV